MYFNTKNSVLSNGMMMMKDMGKYRSGLIIYFQSVLDMKAEVVEHTVLNLFEEGNMDMITGTYNEGTFTVHPNGEHMLVCHDWGGAFSETHIYGKLEGMLYHRDAASNGGGQGNEWFVIPKGWQWIPT